MQKWRDEQMGIGMCSVNSEIMKRWGGGWKNQNIYIKHRDQIENVI